MSESGNGPRGRQARSPTGSRGHREPRPQGARATASHGHLEPQQGCGPGEHPGGTRPQHPWAGAPLWLLPPSPSPDPTIGGKPPGGPSAPHTLLSGEEAENQCPCLCRRPERSRSRRESGRALWAAGQVGGWAGSRGPRGHTGRRVRGWRSSPQPRWAHPRPPGPGPGSCPWALRAGAGPSVICSGGGFGRGWATTGWEVQLLFH